MKGLCFAASVAMLACTAAGLAQTQVSCGSILDAPLRSRASLNIDSRPAGLEIVGTDRETIHVTCTYDDRGDEEDVRIRFAGAGDNAKLTISGGTLHTNNLKIHIEVPRRTSVRVRMSAGQVTMDDVAGDKDVELTAGQISLRGLHTRDYRRVDASVDVGQVSAPVYGADKGGFFRSFTKSQPDGEYLLRAHVTTGQIELEGSGETAQ
ncbi:MAG TPA: hypothetical protein VME68_18690 [Acidobacteriaceae bacterium]|nr:hypothetical protein [Acidobacteriaceae bacterium]